MKDQESTFSDISSKVKTLAYLVKEIGFPILAFCLMWYTSNVTIKEFKSALEDNTKSLVNLTVQINRH